MAIKTGRVLAGGLVAGILINVANVVAPLLFVARFVREIDAWIPGAASRIQTSTIEIAAGVLMKLALGVVLVWLYAAVRPHFGSGPRAALFVAFVVWILSGIFSSDLVLLGMMSSGTFILLQALQAANLVLASLVGALIHGEAGKGAAPREDLGLSH